MKRFTQINLFSFFTNHLVSYSTPLNLNYTWSFGSLAGLTLVFQILTGIFLAMHYIPHIDMAFNSVEHIMRNIPYGWLVRYMHSNGASMFFIIIYLHIFRNIYYGSYLEPRKAIWVSGILIFLLTMATAFIGYVLPWGQMSFWGVTVITSLASIVPVAGTSLVEWLWGGFSINSATLIRFFSLHYCLPFILICLVCLHLALLHSRGSNNPAGIRNKHYLIPFYPYFFNKDLVALTLFFSLYTFLVFFQPNLLGHPDNYIMANALVTPAHIVPEWYFLPFYTILRSIPHKIGGILAMGASIVVLLLIIQSSKSWARSAKFRTTFSWFFWLFICSFFYLGWLGQKPATEPWTEFGLFWTFIYFFNFLLLPFFEYLDNYVLFFPLRK